MLLELLHLQQAFSYIDEHLNISSSDLIAIILGTE